MIKLGSRSSKLATWQANYVQSELRKHDVEVEIVFVSTEGDQSTQSLREFGGQGAFTKRIQQGLLDGEIDFAVHSLKDLPTEKVEGLSLAAVPIREDPVDVWVSNRFESWESAEPESLVGTGSLRRQAQLLHLRPDLRVQDIRGNVDTRLKKLDSGKFDAIILAKAGLTRLGLSERITQEFSQDKMLPAIGQGALGLECRADDENTIEMLMKINHAETHAEVVAERALLRHLRAGCLAPVGAFAIVNEAELTLSAIVLNQAGTEWFSSKIAGPVGEPAELGTELADELIEKGARKLLERH